MREADKVGPAVKVVGLGHDGLIAMLGRVEHDARGRPHPHGKHVTVELLEVREALEGDVVHAQVVHGAQDGPRGGSRRRRLGRRRGGTPPPRPSHVHVDRQQDGKHGQKHDRRAAEGSERVRRRRSGAKGGLCPHQGPDLPDDAEREIAILGFHRSFAHAQVRSQLPSPFSPSEIA